MKATKKKAPAKSASKKTATAKKTVPAKSASKQKAAVKKPAPAKPVSKKKAAVKKKAAPKAAAKKTVKKAVKKKTVRKAASFSKPIPSILLEGDSSPSVRPGGPGVRYDLGPDADRLVGSELGELPEAYGTGMVIASARDPHWLYVFWDLTDEQQNEYNRASRDKHLVIRLLIPATDDQIVSETHVHPESRNWFIPVPTAGGRYLIELGYNDRKGAWRQVSRSRPVSTPPDELSDDTSADFATLPAEIPFEQLIGIVRQVVAANIPLMEAIEQLRADGYENLPGPNYFKDAFLSAGERPAELNAAQLEALAEVVTMDEVRRVWIGSQEITELVRRQLTSELSSRAAAARKVSSLSSPFGIGGEAGAKGFWFNVNAELIVYGATEPDATVTIGGRPIRLRADGTFSYRFALPDGDYQLPIQATSADGDDSRHADLSFHRGTEYRGEVGVHPQDERLREPRPEHTA